MSARPWLTTTLSLACVLLVGSAAAQSEPTDDAGSLARVDGLFVRRIELRNSTVLTAADTGALVAPYENRMVSLEELHELRHELSRAYVDRGYVSSGVVLPDQRVVDGVVGFLAVEGALTEIAVEGNRRYRDEVIAKRIQRQLQQPLDIAELAASLETLRDDPLVERIDAQLLPGAAPGQSYLRVGMTERRPLELSVTGSNDRSTSVGEDHAEVGLAYRGLLGNGDVLRARLGFTDGVEDSVLGYRVPLGTRGVVLDVLGTDQVADIVEEPFAAIDITSRVTASSLTASYGFRAGDAASLTAVLGFEHRRSESTLLGMPFSFSPGDVDGRARASAFVTGLEWTLRQPTRAWAGRALFHVGVDALDATVDTGTADSKFATFSGQFEFVQNLADDRRIVARGTAQLANDPLLALYKLPIGGSHTVRGYRENQFVRDNGIAASIEYQLPVAVDAGGRARGNVHVAVFADYGASWDEEDSFTTAGTQRIASAGLGVLWDPKPGMHFEVYLGDRFEDLGYSSSSLQERGVHYRATFNRAF